MRSAQAKLLTLIGSLFAICCYSAGAKAQSYSQDNRLSTQSCSVSPECFIVQKSLIPLSPEPQPYLLPANDFLITSDQNERLKTSFSFQKLKAQVFYIRTGLSPPRLA